MNHKSNESKLSIQNRANSKWDPTTETMPCSWAWQIKTITINYIRRSISQQLQQLSHSFRTSIATKWTIEPLVVKTETMTLFSLTSRQMSLDHSLAVAYVNKRNLLIMLLKIANNSKRLTSLGTQTFRPCHQTINKTSSFREPFLPTTLNNIMALSLLNQAA